ncbi:hypothetical protein [Paraburkholderia bryophila]|uniref:Uncharacterized protein n=1 Tax=Paraburkholderia bryophila TaxID=420952 RepID=A0A329BBF0_9BURK|nr:hypothetical protein [Paraburkholderia bryophila]RAS17392.1 hypothetical protein BX591_14628 [Paraburkholderia bryophila]
MTIGDIIGASYVTAILLAVVVVARILDNTQMRKLPKDRDPAA